MTDPGIIILNFLRRLRDVQTFKKLKKLLQSSVLNSNSGKKLNFTRP